MKQLSIKKNRSKCVTEIEISEFKKPLKTISTTTTISNTGSSTFFYNLECWRLIMRPSTTYPYIVKGKKKKTGIQS